MESPFKTNDIVIAKVKGYPPWPAIVVTKENLPEKIRESKPKSYEAAPILFFNDNSYMWAAETDLKILEVEVATKYSQKPKTKKALREAYRMASEQPSVEQYLEMVANPPVVEVEEPPKKRATKASEKPTAAAKSSRSSLKSIKRKLKEGGPLSEDMSAEDAIELKRPKQRGRPSAAKDTEVASAEDLAASTELRAELCRQARLRLQKALLVEDPSKANFAALNTILEQVEQVETIEIAIIRMSKLRRVIRAVSSLELDPQFRARCERLLVRWETTAEPVIRGLPEAEVDLEELKEREGTIERETEPPSDEEMETEPPSEATAEPKSEATEPKQETSETTDAKQEPTEPAELEATDPTPEHAKTEPEAAAPAP